MTMAPYIRNQVTGIQNHQFRLHRQQIQLEELNEVISAVYNSVLQLCEDGVRLQDVPFSQEQIMLVLDVLW